MKNIVIFASGDGSNAENIMMRFSNDPAIRVASLFTNNPSAGAIQKAQNHQVPTVIFSKSELLDGAVLRKLHAFNPDLIVLAGFLLKIPSDIIGAFAGQIINIHPALLPNYGGKGMYGMNVHKAVADNKDKNSGITIHYVDDHYDNGDIIRQEKVDIEQGESCDSIAAKVRKLEHEHFPQVIAELLAQ